MNPVLADKLNDDSFYPSRKRVLFLDDDTDRCRVFCAIMAKYDIIPECVSTAQECIDKLQYSMDQGFAYDLISLDHDLGGEVFVNTDREDCGMEVVRWIEKHYFAADSLFEPSNSIFLVHSYNDPAATRMTERLIGRRYMAMKTPFLSDRYYKLIDAFIGSGI